MPSEAPPAATLDALSADVLFVAVYERLKGMAGNRFACSSDGTLDTTSLVHEIYVNVSASVSLEFSDPAQFFGYASQATRHIYVDHARQRMPSKQGAGVIKVKIGDIAIADLTATQVLGLNEALRPLDAADPRASRPALLRRLAAVEYFRPARGHRAQLESGLALRSCLPARSEGVSGCRTSVPHVVHCHHEYAAS